ncbi:tRNA pseudouridine(38-40) synthase TruA [Bacillus suaedaesalsae]|uniref:tRNA pseudouridine synthase A n=1 Tax=Bacillus suaedaesalsae TaxID=2810349 RepID=A0ABS2DCH7_9BACI|nr:tRNA pseudouridine(38-40) synthase TruA [Bacillus suaedaesalsae]MBM6616169.1 tRNA pseudouridine(38-40) synthase TruA [Bacillus suaedaesalsae]
MQRIKMIISYDGSAFFGYQVQPNQRTVQSEIEGALKNMHKGSDIRIYASGRTDAGVHAVGQVIHFDSPYKIPASKWKIALNSLLPNDIAIGHAQVVTNDFHARFDVKKKEYRYKIETNQDRDVFTRNYLYHFPYTLDYLSIKEAIKYLVGTHDFTSFCSAKTEVEDKVRTIYEIEFFEDKNGELIFRFVGDGFLYNMIRIMVGTLLEVGQGMKKPIEILEILEAKNRQKAGKTVPGTGLYLWKVYYDN